MGYLERDLTALCVGTPARLIRTDFVTRASASYMRRSRWPRVLQPFNATWNSLTRKRSDRSIAGRGALVGEEFLSITGVYQLSEIPRSLRSAVGAVIS